MILTALLILKALWLWTEWEWFASLGYHAVLKTIWLTRLGLFAVTLPVAALLLLGSLRYSLRCDEAPRWSVRRDTITVGPVIWAALPALLWLGAVGVAYLASTLWEPFLTMLRAAPSGTVDPVFGRDVSFYLLQLPLWLRIQRLLLGVLLVVWVGLYFRYVELPMPSGDELVLDLRQMSPRAAAHLSRVGAAVLLTWAWGFWLARYGLLTSSRSGAVWGAGYTDVHVRLPLLAVMAALALLVAAALWLGAHRLSWPKLAWTLGGFVVALLLSLVVPAVCQRLVVLPSEVERERPYIERCIAATRAGLGLDRADVRQYDGTARLSADELAQHEATLATVPLWSVNEITEQLVGTESLRAYYNFWLADYDRYELGGKLEQVAVMVREMQTDRLEPAARTWVNRHLVYTHGYGLVMASAHRAAEAGQPVKIVRNIPPEAPPELTVTQPGIYYGEIPSDYIITGLNPESQTKELDYPRGDRNVLTTYAGDGGVRLGGFARRLAMALRFRSINLLVSDLPTPDSRIHFRRDLGARLHALAPFLDYDSDPYPVLADGRIYWIADAYTVSASYPYGWQYPLYPAVAITSDQPEAQARRSASYIRNSVKVVMDAYTGRVTFHVYDPRCPILATYRRIFPTLFVDTPPDPAVARHVRYPSDLFSLQARAYARFHMTDPNVFYNGEDLWDVAREETTTRVPQPDGTYAFRSARARMVPYYVLLRLPGEDEPRFRLIVPFTPASAPDAATGRDNMVGWLAADCDPGETYGRLTVFNLPKNKLVYGPLQVEALLDQDADISQQMTLWSEQGSRVIRGRLLVVPLGQSLLYVEPLFITAERRGALPELKRVVVFYNGRVRMHETLAEALAAALSGARYRSGVVELLRLQQQARAARAALDEADRARAAGDLAGYGAALEKLRGVLAEMGNAGGREGSPAPDALPSR